MQYKTGANGCSFTVRPVSISDNRGVPHNQSKSQNRVNLTPTWQVAAVLKGKNFYFRELVFFQNDNLRGGMVVASSNYSRIMVIIIPIQTCWLGAQTNLSSPQTPFAASIPPLWLQWNQPTHPWHLVNIVSYLNCQQLPSDAIEEVHHRSKFNQNVWIPHNCHDLFFVLVYFEVIFWKFFFHILKHVVS